MTRAAARGHPLVIAGSDPSGGAGLQADVKVFMRYGMSAAAVPTALTVQSTASVTHVEPVAAELVSSQLHDVLADGPPTVVKVGLLPDAEVVQAVARVLATMLDVPVVLDPVLASSSGQRFLPPAAVPEFLRSLVARCTLVTPNQIEAAELTGLTQATVVDQPLQAIATLLEFGPQAVLLKGGHGGGDRSVDRLGIRDPRDRSKPRVVVLDAERIPERHAVHGTGCALSSAIAARLALGQMLEPAVRAAKADLTRAIAGATRRTSGARQLDWTAFGA